MVNLEPWFDKAMVNAAPLPGRNKVQVSLPPPPCLPSSVGTAEIRYFAPSQAVWTAARESSLVALLPVEQSRMEARLAHNYELLATARDQVANGCSAIIAMRRRFAQPDPDRNAPELWTMTPAQAEKLAETAANTQMAIQGLLFRLRWSKVYEEGIKNGESAADVRMMTINQERFEEQPALDSRRP
jgi:hypothetical protein